MDYGHGLVSWSVYQNVACGKNLSQVRKGLVDIFGFHFRLPKGQLYRFKSSVARYYRRTYRQILERIVSGKIIHIDETEVALRGKKGYVWVLASLDAVYFVYRDSREGAFLKEMLKDFSGVLVSDCFSAYDSVLCAQQKCLAHLLRDVNEDLLRNPFDEEFRNLAQEFGRVLRKIVETIDRFGLRKRHLHKHRADVQRFFKSVLSRRFVSEAAQKLQTRLQKYEWRFFTFLDYDNVPWNNNYAEHAIKSFARYRRFADGRFTEASIGEYLVMLSIFQTCEYRGVKFLDFLLSEKTNIEGFALAQMRVRRRGT